MATAFLGGLRQTTHTACFRGKHQTCCISFRGKVPEFPVPLCTCGDEPQLTTSNPSQSWLWAEPANAVTGSRDSGQIPACQEKSRALPPPARSPRSQPAGILTPICLDRMEWHQEWVGSSSWARSDGFGRAAGSQRIWMSQKAAPVESTAACFSSFLTLWFMFLLQGVASTQHCTWVCSSAVTILA